MSKDIQDTIRQRKHAIGAKHFGGNKVSLPGMYTIPLGLAFGNH
jgi:hypothetical protein